MNTISRTFYFAVCLVLAFLMGCKEAVRSEESTSPQEKPPVESQGPTVVVYKIAGWERERVEKAFGKPTKIAKKKDDFIRSINEPSMNKHLDEEVEQWLIPAKIGLMRTLVTFDKDGKAVRAICEWSDY